MSRFSLRFSALLFAFVIKFGALHFFDAKLPTMIAASILSVAMLVLAFAPIRKQAESGYEGA